VQVSNVTKARIKAGAIVAGVLLLVAASVLAVPQQRRSIQGADQMVLNGGGLRKVFTNSAGVLGGSGTSGNPLTVTISQGSGLAGTGSSGDALATDTTSSFNYVSGKLAMPNDYAATHMEWVDEFMYGAGTVANDAKVGMLWGANVSSGTFSGNATGTTTRPGIGELGTGTTTTGRIALTTGTSHLDFGSGTWNFQWTGGFPTLSTGAEEYATVVGFLDNSGAVNQVDGCYFLYDRGNVATSGPNTGNADKLSCWCASNSNRTTFLMDGTTVSNESFTTVNAPVAALTLPSTNIYSLEVRMTGTTRAEFFVNGTKSCNINTNIPSGATRLLGAGMLIIKSAGTTARQVDVDRAKLAVDLTAARSP